MTRVRVANRVTTRVRVIYCFLDDPFSVSQPRLYSSYYLNKFLINPIDFYFMVNYFVFPIVDS